ncbi:hypothetical protein [Okeania sp. SIO1I7]|nr:hypothetical protein [Okeania sp. SIO1I7]
MKQTNKQTKLRRCSFESFPPREFLSVAKVLINFELSISEQ